MSKSENLDRWLSYGIDTENRNIDLSTVESHIDSDPEIDAAISSTVVRGILYLSKSRKPFTIYISSCGGNWTHGLAIYHILRQANKYCYITGEVIGEASSMASIILQACTKRIIHPYAHMLIHDGEENPGTRHCRSAEAAMEYSKICREIMYGIYAERSTQNKAYFRRNLITDKFVTAQKALELGLVDQIAKFSSSFSKPRR